MRRQSSHAGPRRDPRRDRLDPTPGRPTTTGRLGRHGRRARAGLFAHALTHILKPVHLLHVVGARPNLPKLAPVYRAAARRGELTQTVVHTGQHYDDALFSSLLT